MEDVIKLKLNTKVNIAALKGSEAYAKGLQIAGTGNLLFALIEFFNDNEPEVKRKDLYFLNPDFSTAKFLPPKETNFNIGMYDYCMVKILTGVMGETDEILLYHGTDTKNGSLPKEATRQKRGRPARKREVAPDSKRP